MSENIEIEEILVEEALIEQEQEQMARHEDREAFLESYRQLLLSLVDELNHDIIATMTEKEKHFEFLDGSYVVKSKNNTLNRINLIGGEMFTIVRFDVRAISGALSLYGAVSNYDNAEPFDTSVLTAVFKPNYLARFDTLTLAVDETGLSKLINKDKFLHFFGRAMSDADDELQELKRTFRNKARERELLKLKNFSPEYAEKYGSW